MLPLTDIPNPPPAPPPPVVELLRSLYGPLLGLAITGVILGGLALITSVTVPAIADSPPRQTKTVILGLLVFLFGVLCFIAITYSG